MGNQETLYRYFVIHTKWYAAMVERFFGNLKHDWVFKIAQPSREHIKKM